MHETQIKFVLKFSFLSPFLLFSSFPSVLTFLRAFLLAAVIGMEIVKTDTSFLTHFSLDIGQSNNFSSCKKSIWYGRYLFFLSSKWYWYLLWESYGCDPVFIFYNAKNFFGGLGPFYLSGFDRYIAFH